MKVLDYCYVSNPVYKTFGHIFCPTCQATAESEVKYKKVTWGQRFTKHEIFDVEFFFLIRIPSDEKCLVSID